LEFLVVVGFCLTGFRDSSFISYGLFVLMFGVVGLSLPLEAKVMACQRLRRAHLLAQVMVSATYTSEGLENLVKMVMSHTMGSVGRVEFPSFPDVVYVFSDLVATYLMSVIEDAIVVFCGELAWQSQGRFSEGGQVEGREGAEVLAT